jgi:hypothetical protein
MWLTVVLLLLWCVQMTLDNVVELLLNYGVPQLPFLPRPEPQPSPGLRLSLHHTYEVTPPNTVRIVFESTSARAIGPDFLQVGCASYGRPNEQQQLIQSLLLGSVRGGMCMRFLLNDMHC